MEPLDEFVERFLVLLSEVKEVPESQYGRGHLDALKAIQDILWSMGYET